MRPGRAGSQAECKGSRSGWTLPGFSAVGRGRVRKRGPLSGAQRPHAAYADHADLHAGYLPPGPDELRSALARTSAEHPIWPFPAAAAYALLVLTNLVYNSFGGDGGGIQLFYASPVRFRQIVLGKNLTHPAILHSNAVFAWIAVTYLYGAAHLEVTVATLAGLLFAAPLNLPLEICCRSTLRRNWTSPHSAARMRRRSTVLISFGVQIVLSALAPASSCSPTLRKSVDRGGDFSSSAAIVFPFQSMESFWAGLTASRSNAERL